MKTKACALLRAITDSVSTAAAFCPTDTLGLHALVLLNQEVSACIIKVTLFWQKPACVPSRHQANSSGIGASCEVSLAVIQPWEKFAQTKYTDKTPGYK